MTAKPKLLVTRRLPPAVTDRLMKEFDAVPIPTTASCHPMRSSPVPPARTPCW